MDAVLDRLHQQTTEKLHIDHTPINPLDAVEDSGIRSRQRSDLEGIICTLSVTTGTKLLLRDGLLRLLSRFPSAQLQHLTESSDAIFSSYVSDLAWLAAGKAAVQTLGLVMTEFLERALILDNEIRYWDGILQSSWYASAYAVQTLPIRCWRGAKEKYSNWTISGNRTLGLGWAHFYYNIVGRYIKFESIWSLRARVLSPFWMLRTEVRHHQNNLKAVKSIYASSIGILMEECFSFETADDARNKSACILTEEEWCSRISRSVIMMEAILQNATSQNDNLDFETRVFATVERKADGIYRQLNGQSSIQEPTLVIGQLVHILQECLPNCTASSVAAISEHGRPSWFVRYWLPFLVAILSTSTSLKVLTKKSTDLIRWAADVASTAVDFGGNWVIEPIQKLVKTIRHDENSEIAIISKGSLEADRASLERMVVEFVQDHPDLSGGHSMRSDTEAIANKVKEGDLTPVLKAYERDLRTPFAGTIRGDLIRALLIQIQKTKVDIEIAMSGIDAILKSQELVFGFVGLTPGILVSYAALSWLWGLFDSRKGLRIGRKRDDLRRALRKVSRALTSSSPSANGILSYEDHGVLICEAELLLQRAKFSLNEPQYREFQEDIRDLMDFRQGIDRQLKVVERIRWAYSRYF